MSINTYGYDGRMHVYKAPIVDLWNAIDAALKQLDNDSEFGKEFMKVVGSSVRKLLNAVSKNFDESNVVNTNSMDYLMSDRVWFNVSELRARIRGANDTLSKANLVPLIEVFIAQLRRRVQMLDRANVVSEYTAGLSDALQTTLKLIPDQQEKKIRVPDRSKPEDGEEQEQEEEEPEQQSQDGEGWKKVEEKSQGKSFEERKMRVITIRYEPFVDQVNVGFSAAAKVQRTVNQQKREQRAADTKNASPTDKKSDNNTWKKVQRK